MSNALAAADRATVRAISRELDTLRIDGRGTTVGDLLPAIRSALDAEIMALMCHRERADGTWDLERWHVDDFARSDEMRSRFVRLLDATDGAYGLYNPSQPEVAQRNRVVDSVTARPEHYRQLKFYSDVIVPVGLHRHRQPRVLVCDGNSLLSWFGAFHPEPFTARQNALLGAFVPAMRRRLSIERRLASSDLRYMLDHVLDRLGAPAFVIDARARIVAASQSARALFDAGARDIAGALRDALAARATRPHFELTAIAGLTARTCWLAIVRADSADERIALAVETAATRWRLTPRQRQVLELVIRGVANRTIADVLLVTERAIELHVTALLDRAGVDSRAALVAAAFVASR